ncbi:MAG: flagellar filament capping protein FliD [Kineosporiaceae bacterium]|nr:flagellar filament capping protein FliD [Kineosporiaceae bacterium]
MAQVSISGAVSGIDTASLINSLVSVQQNQQTLLKKQQSQQQKAVDTFSGLISSLGKLSTKAKSLADTDSWKGSTASSSSTGVSATATGTQNASLTFDVTSVARAHARVSHEAVGSLSTQVASGPLSITKQDGSVVSVATGTGSLADVVAAVNASDAGISASAVQTSPGQYRLQLTAGKTGASSAFTVSGLTGFTGTDVVTQGADAQITIGSNPLTAYTVSSSTNAFTGVVPGLSFTVSRLETGVTVASTVDGSKVADDVQTLVDSANEVLSSIETATAWNATTNTGGALVGDSAARTLQQSLLSLVGSAGAPGVSLNRSGRLSFDRSAFTTAYAADPDAVAAKFGATSSFSAASGVSGHATFSSSTSSTRAGTYALKITTAAAAEVWTADASGDLEGQTIELTRGSKTASYTVQAGDSAADIATALNSDAVAKGLSVRATVDGTDLVFTAGSVGAGSAFTATVDGNAQTRTVVGADVQGTIDGKTAKGSGSILTLVSGSGNAVGLSVDTSFSGADLTASSGNVGSISYQPGLAQRFVQLVQQQTATGTGILSSAKSGRESAVKSLQNQIDDWDSRLTSYRASLQAQFVAMETTLAALKSQSSFLSNFGGSTTSSTG